MLIGGAAVLLLVIAGIVLVALKPPSLRVAGPQELFNVDRKPITDGLSKLPATYEGVRADSTTEPGKRAATKRLPHGVPHLMEPTSDPAGEAERLEKAGWRVSPAKPVKPKCSSA